MIEVSIVPLGGLDEVGARNAYLLVYGKESLLLDCGRKVPDTNEQDRGQIFNPELFPDFSYIFEHDLNLLGVLISHGHFDHSAGTPNLIHAWRIAHPEREDPIFFGSKYTNRMLQEFKWDRMDVTMVLEMQGDDHEKLLATHVGGVSLLDRLFPRTVVEAGERFSVGPFNVLPFNVIHSIPGSLGYLVEVGGKSIVYLGDWKLSGFPDEVQRFEEQIRRLAPVDVFLADSTGFYQPGTSDPDSVASDEVCRIINKHPQGLVVITGFSAHSARWQRVMEWVKNHPDHSDRTMWFVGRSMYKHADVAQVDENLCRRHSNRNPQIKRGDILFVTGCQADDRTVMRRLIGDYPRLPSLGIAFEDFGPDDAVIFSSSTIPISEIEDGVRNLMKRIAAQKASLYLPPGNPLDPTESLENVTVCPVHTSGHAYQDEHRRMVELMDPHLIIPVHGDVWRRESARELFPDREINIARIGEPVTLS